MSSFQRESVATQGWVLGHYLVKKHREGYEMESQQADAKRKNREKENKQQNNHPAFQHREALLRARLGESQGKKRG